jgi:hypothetical protein
VVIDDVQGLARGDVEINDRVYPLVHLTADGIKLLRHEVEHYMNSGTKFAHIFRLAASLPFRHLPTRAISIAATLFENSIIQE